MKIAVAQLNFHVGNFESNTKKIIKCIAEAKTQQVDLIVFSELAICGYPPRDFLEFDDFVEKCMASIHEVAKVSEGISVIVGGPSKNDTGKGKSLFNSAFVITNQKIKYPVDGKPFRSGI